MYWAKGGQRGQQADQLVAIQEPAAGVREEGAGSVQAAGGCHGAFPAVFDCPEAVPLDVADGSDRRSSRSGSVGSARPATVTWGEFVRAPVSKPRSSSTWVFLDNALSSGLSIFL